MNIDNIYLGQKIRTSLAWFDNEAWIVKKIDTDQEMVYVVSLEDGSAGWVSAASVFKLKGE